MDLHLSAAARALTAFDPLRALKYVALREDAAALALRGVAMAQLGEYESSLKLLARAERAFGPSDPAGRARCLAAHAEVSLARRDLAAAGRDLDRAIAALEQHADPANALFARLLRARRLVLLGKLLEARSCLAALELRGAPPRLVAVAELVRAILSMRALEPRSARLSLRRALAAARMAKLPPLLEEVERAARELAAPVALLSRGAELRAVALDEVEALGRSGRVLVDVCRRQVRASKHVVSLVTRPVLFALALALAQSADAEATREALIAAAFGARSANDSLRARLRVEVGRLRKALAPLAEVRATPRGFCMTPRRGSGVDVLLPPEAGEASSLLAVLAGGESWSTSALADAVGSSQRSVQRALLALHAAGRVEAVGRGRLRRWIAPPPRGFATTLLLAARPGPG